MNRLFLLILLCLISFNFTLPISNIIFQFRYLNSKNNNKNGQLSFCRILISGKFATKKKNNYKNNNNDDDAAIVVNQFAFLLIRYISIINIFFFFDL